MVGVYFFLLSLSVLAGLKVEVSTAKPTNVRCSWFGVLEPGKKASINALAFGRVEKKFYRLGQMVEPNDPLIMIEGGALVQAAEAQREAMQVAQKNFARLNALAKKGYATCKDRDEAWSLYKSQEAMLEAKSDMSQKVAPKAPFKGVIYKDYVHEGTVLTNSQGRVCEIASLEQAQVMLTLSYADAHYIDDIQNFQVFEDSGHKMPAVLYAKNPVIEKSTGGVSVILSCLKAMKGFFGTTVRVIGVRKNIPNVHTVPYGALHFERGKIGLLCVKDERAAFLPGEVIAIDEGHAYLTGLPQKVAYIPRGHGSILHGEKVKLEHCDEKAG